MTKKIQHKKIVFTGPTGVGKTTAIQMISDVPVITTNEVVSNMAKDHQSQTTVSMDYGYINMGKKEKVHLYGTPGQERFDFMWDILTKGALGLILLLDNSRENPQQDLKFYTQAFNSFINKGELVVGITRIDDINKPDISDYRHWIDDLQIRAPVFSVDARERQDVSSLIQALLYTLDPGVSA